MLFSVVVMCMWCMLLLLLGVTNCVVVMVCVLFVLLSVMVFRLLLLVCVLNVFVGGYGVCGV